MFKGYYAMHEGLQSIINPPTDASEDDTVIGVCDGLLVAPILDESGEVMYDGKDVHIRYSQVFTYTKFNILGEESYSWVGDNDVKEIISTTPNFKAFEDRSLNVYEPYGMGLFSMYFVYINSGDLDSWPTSGNVGNDGMLKKKLEFHDIFTGAEIATEDIPTDMIGLLPAYIKNGDQIVGVGSVVYTGEWRVLWYKMAATTGVAPTVVYTSESVIETQTFVMMGNTTSFTLKLYTSEEEPAFNNGVIASGDYVSPLTVYDLSAIGVTWSYLILWDPNGKLYYRMDTLALRRITELSAVVTGNTEAIALATHTIQFNLVPRIAADGFISDISFTQEEGDGHVYIKPTKVDLGFFSDSFPLTQIPQVSSTYDGVMSKDDYITFQNALDDINTLQSAGGKWIGVSYTTLAALIAAGNFSDGFAVTDYTYVLEDENHGDVRTVYSIVDIYDAACVSQNESGNKWLKFARTDAAPALTIATNDATGIVKSSSQNGKISVALTTGEMTLNGYGSIISRLTALESRLDDASTGLVALANAIAGAYTAPSSGPLSGKSLSEALLHLNDVITGTATAIINHAE